MPLQLVHSLRARTIRAKARKFKYAKQKYRGYKRGKTKLLVGNRVIARTEAQKAETSLRRALHWRKEYTAGVSPKRRRPVSLRYQRRVKPRIEWFKVKSGPGTYGEYGSHSLTYDPGLGPDGMTTIQLIEVQIASPGPLYSRVLIDRFSFAACVTLSDSSAPPSQFGMFAVLRYATDKKPYVWAPLLGAVDRATGCMVIGDGPVMVFKKDYSAKRDDRRAKASKKIALKRGASASFGTLSLHLVLFPSHRNIPRLEALPKPSSSAQIARDVKDHLNGQKKRKRPDDSPSDDPLHNNMNTDAPLIPSSKKSNRRHQPDRAPNATMPPHAPQPSGQTVDRPNTAARPMDLPFEFRASGVVRYNIHLSSYG